MGVTDARSVSEPQMILVGDCVEVMARMEACSVDAVVCDPPYGLSGEPDMAEVLRHWLAGDDYEHRGGGFMGRSWDSFVPGPIYWKAVLRVLKPGGYLLAFGGSRTFDMLVTAVRLSGFEIRDRILVEGESGEVVAEPHPTELAWLYGSGFPKSLDVSRAIDKAARGVPAGHEQGRPGEPERWQVQDAAHFGRAGRACSRT